MPADIFISATVDRDDVIQALTALQLRVRDALLKRVMVATVRPISEAAKAACPRGITGILAESINYRISSKGSQGTLVTGVIGPERNILIPIDHVKTGLGLPPFVSIPTRYAHLVEFGHEIVVAGVTIGHVAPRPFMRTAWYAEGGDYAADRFAINLAQELGLTP